MPIHEGARYVPGNKNRIQLTDGTIVTRHEAEKIGAQALGFENNKEYRAYIKHLKTRPLYGKYVEEGKAAGISKRETTRLLGKVDWSDNRPDGSKAQFLVRIGRRNATADYDVGDTP